MEKQIQQQQILHLSPYPSPLPPSPTLTLPLSRLDADRNFDVSFRTLRFYPPTPTSIPEIFAVFSAAFSASLSLFFPLAGTLHRLDNGHLVLICNAADTVPLTCASSSLSLSDIDLDQPTSPYLDYLAPVDDNGTGSALALQVTRFACGGIALGTRVAHAVCDGAGATKFLAAAARFARGEGSPTSEPVWDRLELLGSRSSPRVDVPFEQVLGFDAEVARRGVYDLFGDQTADALVKECFHVSDTCVERLRSQLAQEAGSGFTTFEVLAALIWRARVQANETKSNEVVKMVYSMNISKILNPALPNGYWGNVCVPVFVSLTAGELVQQPLSDTAMLIKKSKKDVNEEYVRSYIDFQELHYTDGITACRNVCAFTDWRRLGHSELDFGWGGPDVVLPLSWRILGSVQPCFFLPYGVMDERKNQGFKVFLASREKALPRFRDEIKLLSLHNERIIEKL